MAKIIQIEGLSDHGIEVLNQESERNKISRNSLLMLIVETFIQNVELQNATEILSEPLEDVTKQLNKLTQAVTDSNRAVSYDIAALTNAIQENNLIMSTAFNEIKRH